jgi:hypothetical protein
MGRLRCMFAMAVTAVDTPASCGCTTVDPEDGGDGS